MKTRLGFVSNSSSSSFTLTGVILTSYRDAKARAAVGERVWCVDLDGGMSGDCADFVFLLTPDAVRLVDPCRSAFRWRRVFFVAECPESGGGQKFRCRRDESSPGLADGDGGDRIRNWITYRLEPYVDEPDEEGDDED